MSDEQHRHQCEVRQWLRWASERGRDWWLATLQDIAARRGPDAAARLRRDVSEQYRLGNRGAPGDWREEPDT